MIAVAGGKGGSGKTTTTLGLARAIAERGRENAVFAVDADWDLPNLASLAIEADIGVNSRATPASDSTAVPSVIDALEEPHSVFDSPEGAHSATDARRRSGPRALGAPSESIDRDPRACLSALRRLSPSGATVLVDCPAGASPDAAAPLRVADGAVLVTPLDRASLRDTAKTAAMARALDCPPIGVVVTRASTAPDRLSELLDCPVLGAVPAAPPEPLSTDAVTRAFDAVAAALGRAI